MDMNVCVCAYVLMAQIHSLNQLNRLIATTPRRIDLVVRTLRFQYYSMSHTQHVFSIGRTEVALL